MNYLYIYLTLSLAACFFWGCKKEGEPKVFEAGEYVADISKPFHSMSEDDIIVSVNAEELTLARYNRLLKQFEVEQSLQNSGAPDLEQKVKLQVDLKSRSLIEEFVDQCAVLEEAARLDLEPSAKNKQRAQQHADKLMRASGKEFREFAEMLGYSERAFAEKIEQDALRMTLRDVVFTNDLSATQQELEWEKERYAHYNEMCSATNKLVIAKGNELVRKLREGADFEKLAAEHSEMPGQVDVINEYTRSDIYEIALREAAFSLPIGSVSDPIETESGLNIIKIIARNEIKADDIESGEKSTVTMASMLLKLGQLFPCPTDDELKAFITNQKQNYVYRQYLNSIRDKCRIEYPNGTNFWEQAKVQAEK
ncbi:MAG: peptidylprolyl isomerase [Kiritimatiellae bacterium]|nr:peptidylprolyl isomerase [Kiritimatiellia bacterium]